jgi:hypothetical protein
MKNNISSFIFALCATATLFVACEKDAIDTTNVVGNVYFITNKTNDTIQVSGTYAYTIYQGVAGSYSSTDLPFNDKIGSRQTYFVTKSKVGGYRGNDAITSLRVGTNAGQILYMPDNGTNRFSEDWENPLYWTKNLNSSKDTAYYTLTIY